MKTYITERHILRQDISKKGIKLLLHRLSGIVTENINPNVKFVQQESKMIKRSIEVLWKRIIEEILILFPHIMCK